MYSFMIELESKKNNIGKSCYICGDLHFPVIYRIIWIEQRDTYAYMYVYSM